MKITLKHFHIPPHLSTTWSQVRTLYLKNEDLVVCLIDGTTINIPGLNAGALESIFSTYATFIEEQSPPVNSVPVPERAPPFQIFQFRPQPHKAPSPPFTEMEGVTPIDFNPETLESLSSAMQHNQAQAQMPDLPKEILSKIASVAKIVAADDVKDMPKPEPHCNCTHCQIARAIHQSADQTELDCNTEWQSAIENQREDEMVSDSDLVFQQWEIVQTGDQLFSVANRLDSQEKYSVFLGQPIGCTCGQQGCEHILAVLKS